MSTINTNASSLTGKTTLYQNVDQNIIAVSEDRLKLCLYQHKQFYKSRMAWITPLGLFISFLTTLLTSNFKDNGLKAPTWEAIFIVGVVICLIWLIRDLIVLCQNWRKASIDEIINKLKNTNIP